MDHANNIGLKTSVKPSSEPSVEWVPKTASPGDGQHRTDCVAASSLYMASQAAMETHQYILTGATGFQMSWNIRSHKLGLRCTNMAPSTSEESSLHGKVPKRKHTS